MHSIEIKKYYSNASVKILNVFVANIKRNIYTLSMKKTKFRKQNGRKCQYFDDTEGRPQYELMTTFMTNISNAMSDEKVMLLMGHNALR